MLQGIAVRGEISNFKRHTSGHLYFSLVDDSSRISCVMFRQAAQMLRFTPRDGMRVILAGAVGLYTATGSYQLYGEAMQQDGTGSLYERYLEIRDRLQREGIFDVSRKKPLPLMPKGIGIITSGAGAVLHDIITVSRRRLPAIPLVLRSAQVQGSGAAEDMLRALAELASLPDIEVIIIGRGGGSMEDLWPFNDEALVRAVAACKKPVISAVGHETNITLVDFAADVRAPTPSAAAELAVPQKQELDARIAHLLNAFHADLMQHLQQKQHRLEQASAKLRLHNPENRLGLVSSRLAALSKKLQQGADASLEAIRLRAQAKLDRFEHSGPKQTLKRGYVIAMDQQKPVLSAQDSPKSMVLQFLDGQVKVERKSVNIQPFGGIRHEEGSTNTAL